MVQTLMLMFFPVFVATPVYLWFYASAKLYSASKLFSCNLVGSDGINFDFIIFICS